VVNEQDLGYLENRDFLLTKKKISENIITLLAATESELKAYLEQKYFPFPTGTFRKAGKISKGENYLDLPYFILDYPRLFKKESVFAFRTMIWWGNEISHTLQLSGQALAQYRANLIAAIHSFSSYYLCVNTTPWEYHFDEDNYQKIEEMDEDEIEHILHHHSFIKISHPSPLTEINMLPKTTLNHLQQYLRAIFR
jgi:hypothetical protein